MAMPLVEQKQYVTKSERIRDIFLGLMVLCGIGMVVGFVLFTAPNNGLGWHYTKECFVGFMLAMSLSSIFNGISESQGEQYIVPPREQWGNCTYWRVLEGGKVVPAEPGLQRKANLFSIMSSQTFVFQSVLRSIGYSLVLQSHRVKVTVPLDSTDEAQRAELVAKVVSWWSRFSDAHKNPQTDRMAHQLSAEAKRTDLPFTIEILPEEQPFKAG